MKSEVAQLRQRIEEEITSMHLLMNSPAVVSRHELITHKYRNLDMYQRELARLVGEKPAAMIVDKTYHRMMEEDKPCHHEQSHSLRDDHPQRRQEAAETEGM